MTKHCGHYCNRCLWGSYIYNRHINLQTDIVCCCWKCQPLCCSANRKERRR
ncbi:hypothetical protein N337_00165, partial [Phoenicopterus ruber ruber]